MPKPNIILVTLDTMRADRLGRERGGRLLTPNLSEFGSEGRAFTHAVAAGIPTYFGFPPMFRGGGALDGGKVIGLPVGTTTFVEKLSLSGYRTAAVIASNPYLSHYYRYDTGFDIFDDFYASDMNVRRRRDGRTSMRVARRVAGERGTARLKRIKAHYNYIKQCAGGANPALHEGSRAEKVTERVVSRTAPAPGAPVTRYTTASSTFAAERDRTVASQDDSLSALKSDPTESTA